MDNNTLELAQIWIPAASGLGGALLGGLATLHAANRSHRNQLKRDARALRREKLALLQAIRDEVAVVWSQYEGSMGKSVASLQPREPFLVHYAVYGEYFPVFKGNADKLGLIEDRETRQLVIDTHALAQFLIDVFKRNNDLLSERKSHELVLGTRMVSLALHPPPNVQPPDDARFFRFIAINQEMLSYATELKETQEQIRTRVTELLERLDAAI